MVSCLGLRKDDIMVFICANWSMTSWSIVVHCEMALGFVTEGYIAVLDCMLISILYMLVEPLEMTCAEAADALAPWASDVCLRIE